MQESVSGAMQARAALTFLCATVSALLLAGAGGADPGAGPGPVPTTPYSGFDPLLARAPYVTDLKERSALVNWATTARVPGTLTYGPPGDCAASSIDVPAASFTQVRVSPNPTTTYPARSDYLAAVRITGLSPGSAYCYQVLGNGVDLLPASQPSQSFTTLDVPDRSSTAPLTFAVVGDFGETANRGRADDPAANNPSSVNSNQSAVDSLIGSSGARFVVAVGDVAYNDGGQYDYGDLEQTGTSIGSPGKTEISDVFGPSYWPLTGGIPVFAATGNHGLSSPLLTNWPEIATATASGGTYALQQYGSVDGTTAKSYPSTWYAFSSGNVRFYVLDASWSDTNLGTATGADCPLHPGSSNCKTYEIDADAHFQPSSPEYQWLAADLQGHPGGIKLAFFHYPLRSDDSTEESDVYLQRTLEPLLAQNGVDLAFSGHAHDYERNTTAGPNTVAGYVTGGGGGVVTVVAGKGCSSWDAYAIGWGYTSGHGSRCGSAPQPTSDAQVYHFLKVTVAGNKVTVDPIDAAGEHFDKQTYTFAGSPTAPSNVSATATSPNAVQLTWDASSEAGGTIASYRISRNGTALATVAAPTTSYLDSSAAANGTYTYTVTAVDGSGVTSPPGTSNTVTTPLLVTGFESGSLTGWRKIVGQVALESATVHSGSFALGVSSTGSQSFALRDLPAASPVLYAQGWVDVASQSSSATLFALRSQATPTSAAAQVAQVYLAANGTVKVLNNVTKASFSGTAKLLPGAWHQVTLAVDVGAGTIGVWLDGTAVLSVTGQSLGTALLSTLEVGDEAGGRTYSWFADDLVVSTVAPS